VPDECRVLACARVANQANSSRHRHGCVTGVRGARAWAGSSLRRSSLTDVPGREDVRMMLLPLLGVLAAACASCAAWLVTPSCADMRMSSLLRERRHPPGQGSGARSDVTGWVADLRRRWTGRIGREHRERVRDIQALTALATELRAGHPLATALRHAGGVPCVWPTAVSAARFGTDIAGALRVDALSRPLLLPLAACWQVGSFSGSGLARTVEELARSGRAGEDTRAQLEAHLASAHASMRVLASLPILGIAMGTMLGAEPIAWFAATGIGRIALACGLALTGMGLWWSRRITRSVERLL
jgi:tight adherence protein B